MSYFVLCFFVFLGAYLVNILYISIFYHRGLTHRAVTLKPWIRSLVIHSGNWITGLDPKGWICMHRLHHAHADTSKDPHSPVYEGVLQLMLVQLRSYEKTLSGLIKRNAFYSSMVPDLEFPVNWLNRKRLWYLPYLLHAIIALSVAIFFNAWLLGASYWLGIMSHPIQGWMVNSLGHAYGYRSFETKDHSKNNLLVAALVMGEGFQNNHHQSPTSARFSVKWWEIDLGYGLCLLLKTLRLIEIGDNSTPRGRHLSARLEPTTGIRRRCSYG